MRKLPVVRPELKPVMGPAMKKLLTEYLTTQAAGQDDAFERVANCGRFRDDSTGLNSLALYELEEINSIRELARDLAIMIARYNFQIVIMKRLGDSDELIQRVSDSRDRWLKTYQEAGSARKEKDVARAQQRGDSSNGEKTERKSSYTYKLPEKYGKDHPCHTKSEVQVRGQGALVRDYYAKQNNGAASSSRDVTDSLIAGGFTCNQDPHRAIKWVLDEWTKKGWLIRS